MNQNAAIPAGWSHNPSACPRRVVPFSLALLGFVIAFYLALYQLGTFSKVWEPFFGDGSEKVLHSGLSKILPIPDAAFGALAYLLEAVAELVGGSERWRKAPWAVAAFGTIAGLMAMAGVVLVLWQALVVGAWCTLCLCSATISCLIALLGASESRATWKHVRFEEQHGFSFWSALGGKAG